MMAVTSLTAYAIVWAACRRDNRTLRPTATGHSVDRRPRLTPAAAATSFPLLNGRQKSTVKRSSGMGFRWGRDTLTDVGLLMMRLMLGSVFIFHGAQKLFGVWDGPGLVGFATYIESLQLPYPPAAAVLAGAAELLGGLALVTGISMRLATLPLIFTMGVAIVVVHARTMSMMQNGFEYPLTLAVVLAGLACTGPGRFWLNLDRVPKLRKATERVELGSYTSNEYVSDPLPAHHTGG